uniref:CAP-Gly domain-containing protein n=1 Tax=Rhizochromulina marina TaxID=1034831 RepID=A0A7S2W9K5_9STRA|mmetsp:Transcript_18047/g.52726  ORF Transcript_18047/g.52726 Transcript_18047/m.52726 type:complete len:294 (+) Transcript_18047:107-988(+)|eukprot:CAMPEP_0118961932 /NCGR_PEP_ID=MMETSP1173-20130426/452_1 /TAXON_ID=1034831 /ORGANISM="Rhizochromulina marina cf, Strain CCMP1243" /LENGTH=293 /DNA_ID=CAMNT_0006910137 /DNA_START=92 /DNA_END=973 /DNA_ORIENTATION=-
MTQNLGPMMSNLGAEMRGAIRDYVTQDDGRQWDRLPQGMIAVHCTHSNVSARMIELKFDLHTTVGEVKSKLHRHCGTPAQFQRLVLKDGGQPICELSDDSRMLGFYSVESGMTIHIIDEDPYSLSRGGGLEDTSLIEKYRMSEDTYDKRKGTVREWIREQKAKDPNWKPPKANMMTGNPWARQDPQAAAEPEEEVPVGPETVEGIKIGDRCEVMPGARRGTVAFVGEVEGLGSKGGHWVGVTFDEPVGKSDGTVKGQTVFECPPGFGGFIRGRNLTVGDFPEEDLDLEDEDEI